MSNRVHAQSLTQAKKNQSTQITADDADWNWKKGEFKARGGVILKHGQLKITCDHATAIFEHTMKEVTGNPHDLSSFSLRSVVASGQVLVKYKTLILKAHTITYNHINQSLKVSGRLNGTWGEHILSGRDLVIQLNEDTAKVKNLNTKFIWTEQHSRQSVFGR